MNGSKMPFFAGPNATAKDYTGCKGAGRHQVHFDNNHTLTLKMQVRFEGFLLCEFLVCLSRACLGK